MYVHVSMLSAVCSLSTFMQVQPCCLYSDDEQQVNTSGAATSETSEVTETTPTSTVVTKTTPTNSEVSEAPSTVTPLQPRSSRSKQDHVRPIHSILVVISLLLSRSICSC